jgi:drug/metabolite transporter (DMT)-like permease
MNGSAPTAPAGSTLRAALWMFGAIASFTSMAIAGRAVSGTLDTFEIMLYRSLTGIIIVLVVAASAGKTNQFRTQQPGLHLVRNLAHFTGQNLWFFAIPLIPLAQLFALEFTTPIWVILLSPLLLGERVTRIGLLAAGIGFSGILVVAFSGSLPGSTAGTGGISIGMIAAAGCAVFFALTAILTRRLTRDDSILCIMFFLTVLQAVFGLICAGIDGDIALPDARSLPWVLLIGCAGLLAHFCLTTALSLAPASTVMPIDFIRLPVIAIVGVAFYNEPISLWVFLGAALIFGGNYLNLMRPIRAQARL